MRRFTLLRMRIDVIRSSESSIFQTLHDFRSILSERWKRTFNKRAQARAKPANAWIEQLEAEREANGGAKKATRGAESEREGNARRADYAVAMGDGP